MSGRSGRWVEDVEILERQRGLLAIGPVGWIVVGVEDALVRSPGLRVLLFDREVLS